MVSKKEKKEKFRPEEILDALLRKWSILILKDLFMGAKTFNDFLKMNERISGKVLSDQLKNLEKYGYIKKVVVSTTPLKAEYQLTELGQSLNKVLYEMCVFARNHLISEDEYDLLYEDNLKKSFGIKNV